MRHVALVGMMGSGKTEVGRELARLLEVRFVDCDELVAAQAQRPIAEIFADEGEAGFRRRESATLAEVLAGESAAVVATGGGVVIDAGNRRLLGGAEVCWLRARPEVLAARVGDDPGRPLLAGGTAAARLAVIAAEREAWYSEAAAIVVDTDDLSVAEAAAALADHLARPARPETADAAR